MGNSKDHFVMTIVTWIRVHPYKATHFENHESILHFIAFMVLHKDSHHNCYRLTNFVSNTGDPTIVSVVHIYNMIAHFTILFVLIVCK